MTNQSGEVAPQLTDLVPATLLGVGHEDWSLELTLILDTPNGSAELMIDLLMIAGLARDGAEVETIGQSNRVEIENLRHHRNGRVTAITDDDTMLHITVDGQECHLYYSAQGYTIVMSRNTPPQTD
jgi:hypothetical protein